MYYISLLLTHYLQHFIWNLQRTSENLQIERFHFSQHLVRVYILERFRFFFMKTKQEPVWRFTHQLVYMGNIFCLVFKFLICVTVFNLLIGFKDTRLFFSRQITAGRGVRKVFLKDWLISFCLLKNSCQHSRDINLLRCIQPFHCCLAWKLSKKLFLGRDWS